MIKKENQLKNIVGNKTYEYSLKKKIPDLQKNKKVNFIKNDILSYLSSNNSKELIFLNNKNAVFNHFFDKFFCYMDSLLFNNYPQISKLLSNKAKNNFFNSIGEKLDIICTRTIIYEMHLNDESNNLFGSSPESKYDYFNSNFLNHNSYIIQILNKNNSMFNAISILISNSFENLKQMTDRLLIDKKEIEKNFFNQKHFTLIQDISSNASDSHRNGKMVFKIKMDNGFSLIYKPRPIYNEIIYQRYLKHFINSSTKKYKNLYYKIISKKSYGWCEYVEYRSCISSENVKKYYHNFGITIFVNMLLNTNDLHFENLISNLSSPIIVDTECIMSNFVTSSKKDSAEHLVFKKINSSVLRSGLLPTYVNLDGNQVDYSAMNGSTDIKLPYKVPRVTNMYRSDMKIIYINPKIKKNNNKVTLNNETINPYKYISNILNGFVGAYKHAIKIKDTLLKETNKINDLNSRVLLKNTQQYSMLLRTSYHPMFCKIPDERFKFLHSIGKGLSIENDIDRFILSSEVADLYNNDIPYFYSNFKSKSLYNSKGQYITNFFEQTSYSIVKNKINSLSLEDLDFQKFLISLKMSKLTKKMRIKEKTQTNFNGLNINNKCQPNIFIKSSRKILDNICDRAIYSKNGKSVNWIQPVLGTEKENSWEVNPLGIYLYDGISGIAIFVNAFLNITKYSNYKYNKLKYALDCSIFNYVESITKIGLENIDSSIGAFYGEASVVYTLQVLFTITKDKKYIKYAEKLCLQLKHLIKYDLICDYLLGSAGVINVLINMYKITKKKIYLKVSSDLLKHILIHSKKEISNDRIAWKSDMSKLPLSGLSHGASGFIISLGKIYKQKKSKRLLLYILKTLNFENSLYDKNLKNWKDNRITNEKLNYKQRINPIAWCHGSGGILLSRLSLFNLVNNKYIEKDIKNAIHSIKELGNRDNNSLCHGKFGNILCLLEAKNFLSKKDKLYVNNVCKSLSLEIINGNWSCGLPSKYENPSFMLGTSGIGYSLLKMNNNNLPNILTLDI
ncbi:type 2 lanthipeptide synthetase LanM family protein [Apilactobacillus xinyiensis]|uniref:type 2 lanthipeptide synthetase LanM family protein n=1 Tax=Apilactobacillus xinyiensis TaxID=2841032 RepID=UPI00200F4FC4|nr:type 2 lanthipeptide synthetase LanM family protein [Apilactobacillus xinyiensis]MCL0330813.1 type 2 lanthipeptide synthetase LanM family protein [Apilactobacillus xinyiensis]